MADTDRLLEEIRRSAIADYEATHWEGSFSDFVSDKFTAAPVANLRTAFQYLRDMIDHFGWDPRQDAGESFRHYRIFDDPFYGGKKAVFGLERTAEQLVNYVRAAAAEEGKERIFVLNGPVGTAKTTLIDLLARGLESYSRTDAGAVYSIAWLFPRNMEDEVGHLGFVRTGPETEDVFARVRCQMHDSPLFLVPRDQREAFVEQVLDSAGLAGNERPVLPRKLLEGELCFNCMQIYDYLMGRYQGDWSKIAQRVQVERILFSELSGVGVSKIQPEGNVETSSSVISFDENYRALSLILSEINLVKFNGKYVAANRGLVHYSDIFKKPVVYLQHLLAACEEHRIDFGEVSADIDVIIVGTSNLPEYEAFSQNPLSHGIRSRMRRIAVPYLLNYRDEMRIYDQGLAEVARQRHVAPHTTELAALWAVLTRLMHSQLHKEVEDLKVDEKDLVEKLALIQKAQIYADEVPGDLSPTARRALSGDVVKLLRNEFPQEGMYGISPRVIQNLFADICERRHYPCLNPFEFFATMRVALERGSEMYEFLGSNTKEDVEEVTHHLTAVNDLYNRTVKREIETAVTDVSEEEILGKIQDYLNNVKAYLRKENLPVGHGDGEVPPNEELMHYVEKRMAVEDTDRDEFRFKVLSRASKAVATGGSLDVATTYADLIAKVRSGLYAEKKGAVNWEGVVHGLGKMGDEAEFSRLPEWTRSVCTVLVDNLTSLFGYCPHCTRDVVTYAIRNRLLD